MPSIIITTPSSATFPFDADALDAAARLRWGTAARTSRGPKMATTIHIKVDGHPGFRIDLHPGRDAISCDGGDQQQVEVAVWIRSLIPDDFPRVIAADEGWSCHVELVPGITEEQFRASVVDHSVPGWNADDPDLR